VRSFATRHSSLKAITMNTALSALIVSSLLWAPAVDIDADVDRDGKVSGTAREEELESSQSVLILNNVDDDDSDGLPDNLNRVVDGEEDWKDLEPIHIRRVTLPADDVERAGLWIEEVSGEETLPRNRFRIFDARGTEVVGPIAGPRHFLTEDERQALACGDLIYYVEGLKFRTSVRLLFAQGIQQDEILLESAPFLLTPTTLRPNWNMVVDVGDSFSRDYVQRFSMACQHASVWPWIVHPDDGSGQSWIQDEVEWGYTQTPRRRMPVALQMFREDRPSGLQGLAHKLLRPNSGHFEAWDYGDGISTQGAHDSGGNLEVTPPVPGYPFGRVYFGSRETTTIPVVPRRIDPHFESFFVQQGVQTPIHLHTDWLSVGHVDEVVTFLPTDGGRSFVMLLASPKLGLKLLDQMGMAAPLRPRYWRFIDPNRNPAPDAQPPVVSDLRGLKYTIGLTGATMDYSFDDYNMKIDQLISGADHDQPDPESIRGIFVKELGLTPDRILEVPMLFQNEGNVWAAGAINPNMVNLASLGSYCLVGEPFIPSFKSAFELSLRNAGLTPLWIDTWINFHLNGGNVHCSSNVVREPFQTNWWEPAPAPLIRRVPPTKKLLRSERRPISER
jgi:protein-arginine deiminase